ncbi:MAG: type II secretion system F family protein [Thermoprotei archaeon]
MNKLYDSLFNRFMKSKFYMQYYLHVKGLINKALLYVDPNDYVHNITWNLFLVSVISFSGFLVLFYYYNTFITLLVLSSPFILLLLYETSMYRKIIMRKKGVDDEIPLFSMFMATIGELGVRLVDIFYEISERSEFRYISREAKKIIRDTILFYGNIFESIDANSINHPSKDWERYMLGITSIVKSGGELSKYLEDKMKEFLNKYKQRWMLYSKHAGDWGELLLLVFLLTSALNLITAVMFPSNAVLFIMITGIVIIPSFTVLSILLIDMSSPSDKNTINVNSVWGIAIGILMFMIVFQFLALWVSLGIAIFVSSLIIYIPTRKLLKEIDEEERWLPAFLLSLTDARKAGISLDQAIAKLRGFGSRVDHILDDLTSQINMGIPLDQTIPKCRSRLFKNVLYVIGELNARGGGTPMVIERIREYIIYVQESQTEAKSSLKIYEILALLTPIILSVMITLTYTFSNINVTMWNNSLGLVPMQHYDLNIMMDNIKVIIVEVSFGISLLISKAKDLTAKSTFLVIATTALALLSLLTIPTIKIQL